MVFYMDNQSISSFCQFETEWLTIRFLCMNYLFNNRQSQDWLSFNPFFNNKKLLQSKFD